MSRTRNTVFFALSGVMATIAAPFAIASGAARATDYVYVETNIKTPNGNSIAAFSRATDGHLTPLTGSPFLTGGAGVQYAGLSVGPADSDQNIVTNADHSLLFAVNSGSDTIAVFHVSKDGSLVPVAGSPFPSGGANPVGLELVDDTLFVANQSGDFGRPSSVLPNYATLRVAADGILYPTSDSANDTSHHFQSTISVARGSSPSQIHAVPGTNLLFGADFLGGLIQRFQTDGQGGLLQLPPLALPASEYTDTATPRLPLGLWHHPYEPLLYVGFVTDSKLGVYRYNEQGGLKFLRTVPNSGSAICWIRTNYAGTRLYTTDTTSNSISVYDLSDAENPVEIQNFFLADKGQVLQFSLSSNERSLYALSSRGDVSIPEGQGNELHTLTVAGDGRLSESISPTIFREPNDTRPQGVLVIPAR